MSKKKLVKKDLHEDCYGSNDIVMTMFFFVVVGVFIGGLFMHFMTGDVIQVNSDFCKEVGVDEWQCLLPDVVVSDMQRNNGTKVFFVASEPLE